MAEWTINGKPVQDPRDWAVLQHQTGLSSVPEWAALIADNDLSRQDVRAILSRTAAAGGEVSYMDAVRRSQDPRLTYYKFRDLVARYGIDCYEEVESASLQRGIEAQLRGTDEFNDVWRWSLWNDPQFYTKAMAVRPAHAFQRLHDDHKRRIMVDEILLYRFARDDWRILLDPLRGLPDYGATAGDVANRLFQLVPMIEEIEFPQDFLGSIRVFTEWLARHGVTTPARMPRLEQIPALLETTANPQGALQPLLIAVYPRLRGDHQTAAYDSTLRQLMDSRAFAVAYVEVGTKAELVAALRRLTDDFRRPAHTLWLALPTNEERDPRTGKWAQQFRLDTQVTLRREEFVDEVTETIGRSASAQVVMADCPWRERRGDPYRAHNELICERLMPSHVRYVGPYHSSRWEDRSQDSAGGIWGIAVDPTTRHITLEYARGRTVVREVVPAAAPRP